MIKIFVALIIFFSYSNALKATNIRVVDLKNIIDNHPILFDFLQLIKIDQDKHRKNFSIQEKELEAEFEKIQQLKLILDKDELDREINNYNEKLNNFNLNIENFNFHYEKQISNLKNEILSEIIELLKKYSINNQIDLILDSNNYILSTNAINISDIILEKSNKIKIETNFEKF